jgi:hypothetical protein
MAEAISIDALRSALQAKDTPQEVDEDQRFELAVRRYEESVRELVEEISTVVGQIPELSLTLEDEVETFTSPAFPGKTKAVQGQRVRIASAENWVLFDPSAKAFLQAVGHVEVQASRPLPFMVERVLYLTPDRKGLKARWTYPSVENLGRQPVPFTQETLLRLLHCVFVDA